MTKADLAAALAADCKDVQSKAAAERIVDTVLDKMFDELAGGGSCTFVGFGTLAVGVRQERNGRNPQTGKEMVIPASKVVRFKASGALKDAVNAN